MYFRLGFVAEESGSKCTVGGLFFICHVKSGAPHTRTALELHFVYRTHQQLNAPSRHYYFCFVYFSLSTSQAKTAYRLQKIIFSTVS